MENELRTVKKLRWNFRTLEADHQILYLYPSKWKLENNLKCFYCRKQKSISLLPTLSYEEGNMDQK